MNRFPSVSSLRFDQMSLASEPMEDPQFGSVWMGDDVLINNPGDRHSSQFSDVFSESAAAEVLELPPRRRSSAQAVQEMLLTLVHPPVIPASHPPTDQLSVAAALKGKSAPTSSETNWKLIIETPFAPKYYRNDRKNLQCFPECHAAVDPMTSERKHNDKVLCRSSLVCRLFPECAVSDWESLKMEAESVILTAQPGSDSAAREEPIRGICTRHDTYFEVLMAPNTWRYMGLLPLKRVEPTFYYIQVTVSCNGRQVALAKGPLFQIGATKALQRERARKREAETLHDQDSGAKKLIKHVVGNAWPWSHAPPAQHAEEEDDQDAGESDVEQQQPQQQPSELRPIYHQENAAALAAAAFMAKAPSQTSTPQSQADSAPVNYPDVEAQMVPGERAVRALRVTEPESPGVVVTGKVVEPQIIAESAHHMRISIALILWLPPFGFFGLHHFYLGRTRWALTTLFTLNVLLLGWLLDAARLPSLVFTSNARHSASELSRAELFLIWLLFGIVGGHHYVAGNMGRGMLYTFTLGLLGVGWLSDWFKLNAMHAHLRSLD